VERKRTRTLLAEEKLDLKVGLKKANTCAGQGAFRAGWAQERKALWCKNDHPRPAVDLFHAQPAMSYNFSVEVRGAMFTRSSSGTRSSTFIPKGERVKTDVLCSETKGSEKEGIV